MTEAAETLEFEGVTTKWSCLTRLQDNSYRIAVRLDPASLERFEAKRLKGIGRNGCRWFRSYDQKPEVLVAAGGQTRGGEIPPNTRVTVTVLSPTHRGDRSHYLIAVVVGEAVNLA
jgi:hypothetical protein